MIVRRSVLGLALGLAFVARAARADAPPPPGYQDPCVAAKIRPEEDCRRCTSPEFKARDCHEDAKKDGYTLRCQAWSYAMYCRASDAGPQRSTDVASAAPSPSPAIPVTTAPPSTASPPAPSKHGCALQPPGASAGGAPLLIVLAAMALVRRRRPVY